MAERPTVILASASAVRADILRAAAVPFEVEPSTVDEAVIKDDLGRRGAAPDDIAMALAEAKALDVAERRPGFVIGADQILCVDERVYDKARDMAEAADRLRMLRGREHDLVGAVAFARGGDVIARHAQRSRLVVRDFSDAFLDEYLAAEGEGLLASVGCYRFEGVGAQLFDRVEGDYYAILGLPLLPVLSVLRAHGALPS